MGEKSKGFNKQFFFWAILAIVLIAIWIFI